jgi:hypothetical protein
MWHRYRDNGNGITVGNVFYTWNGGVSIDGSAAGKKTRAPIVAGRRSSGGGVRQWFAVPRECGRCRIAALCGDAARLERRVREFVPLSATIQSEHCTVCNDHVRREYCMPPPSITPPPSKKSAAAQNQIYHHILIFTFFRAVLGWMLGSPKNGYLVMLMVTCCDA